MASRDVLKVSAFHYKDPSKTDEEFEKHIHEVVNPAWVVLIKRHEVFRYSVTYCPSDISSDLAKKIDSLRPGWTVPTSHAVLTYWVRDLQHLLAVQSDPEFQALGRDAEVGWIDASKGEIQLGFERVYIDNKEIVD